MPLVSLRQFAQRATTFLATIAGFFASRRSALVLRVLGTAAALAALGSYLSLIWGLMGAFAGGADSSGYANNAKLMLSGRLVAEQRQLPGSHATLPAYTYVPLGFVPRENGKMAPVYPLGLSALFVAASVGSSLDNGIPRAILAMVLGSLLATYWLGREAGLGRLWAAYAAVILAACPLFQYMGLQAMSDVPALCWTTLALVFAWASRRWSWLALPAGIAVAVAVFIRPVNALVLVPVAGALGADWRRWLWLAGGGLPGGVIWALTNHALFGRFLTTGYGDAGYLFGREFVVPTLRSYAETIPWLLPQTLFAAFCAPWSRSHGDRRGLLAVAATWIAALAGFYLFYRHTSDDWTYLRFVLPAFPALIVLGVLGMRQVWRFLVGPAEGRWYWPRAIVATCALLLAVRAGYRIQHSATVRHDALLIGNGERIYPELRSWVAANVPANAVVFSMQASGALYYSAPQQVVVNREFMTPEFSREIIGLAAGAGRPVYAALFAFEIEDADCFRQNLVGHWTRIGTVRHASIWRLDDPAGTMP